MNAIRLVPFGNADRNLVDGLREPLSNVFRVPVVRQEALVNVEQFLDSTRGQYNSTAILQHLKQDHKHSDKILAVFNADLYIPILTYVFGEAELNGTVAIVSYYRLKNELYGLPVNNRQLAQRAYKESLHELGHLYGLVHCERQECAMHASTYVEDIDIKGDSFCPYCLEVVREKH